MKFHPLRKAFGRSRPHNRPGRYPELTAEICDELALIADRRRSDLVKF
jgi:hypothetical protein